MGGGGGGGEGGGGQFIQSFLFQPLYNGHLPISTMATFLLSPRCNPLRFWETPDEE